MAPAIAIPESSSADRPGSCVSTGRVIHNSAVTLNTIAIRFSGLLMGPMSKRMRSSSARPSPDVSKSTLKTTRVRTNQVSGNIIAVIGRPTIIQPAKSISTP